MDQSIPSLGAHRDSSLKEGEPVNAVVDYSAYPYPSSIRGTGRRRRKCHLERFDSYLLLRNALDGDPHHGL
jgi:hypothetical protein